MTIMEIVANELSNVHRFDAKTAASIVVTVASVAELYPKPLEQKPQKICPFYQPDHKIGPDDPCPICGLTKDDEGGPCVD